MTTLASALDGAHGADLVEDPAIGRILDAALEVFQDIGVRRSTIEDIARRAGVERITVYRRVGSKNQLSTAVIAREAQRVVGRVVEAAEAHPSLEDKVVAAFTAFVTGLRDHPLLQRLLTLEPETTLVNLTVEAGPLMAVAITTVVPALGAEAVERAGGIDGLVARVELVARLVHSMVLTPRATVPLATEDEIAAFARACVAPIITRSAPEG